MLRLNSIKSTAVVVVPAVASILGIFWLQRKRRQNQIDCCDKKPTSLNDVKDAESVSVLHDGEQELYHIDSQQEPILKSECIGALSEGQNQPEAEDIGNFCNKIDCEKTIGPELSVEEASQNELIVDVALISEPAVETDDVSKVSFDEEEVFVCDNLTNCAEVPLSSSLSKEIPCISNDNSWGAECNQEFPSISVDDPESWRTYSFCENVETNRADSLSLVSCDSGQGSSVGTAGLTTVSDCSSIVVYHFDFPQDLCGLLIGRHGKHINCISSESGTEIIVQAKTDADDIQAVTITGTWSCVQKALELLKNRFPADKFPDVVFESTAIEEEPICQVPFLQLALPDCGFCDAIVSSVVSPNHIFVQQPSHESFALLQFLNGCMLACYSHPSTNGLELIRPVLANTLCAAPMFNGWYRALIVWSDPARDECDVKFVDYGGYARMSVQSLRQIRSDFTQLPFQAIECYLADVFPPTDGFPFPFEAKSVLEELVRGHYFSLNLVGYSEDGKPFVQLHKTLDGQTYVNVSHEMILSGVAKQFDV